LLLFIARIFSRNFAKLCAVIAGVRKGLSIACLDSNEPLQRDAVFESNSWLCTLDSRDVDSRRFAGCANSFGLMATGLAPLSVLFKFHMHQQPNKCTQRTFVSLFGWPFEFVRNGFSRKRKRRHSTACLGQGRRSELADVARSKGNARAHFLNHSCSRSTHGLRCGSSGFKRTVKMNRNAAVAHPQSNTGMNPQQNPVSSIYRSISAAKNG
jgi:hypothetical protein